MAIWTVMFGDDPLISLADTKSSAKLALNVKIFNSREKAYKFRDTCRTRSVYATVAFHPYKVGSTTFH